MSGKSSKRRKRAEQAASKPAPPPMPVLWSFVSAFLAGVLVCSALLRVSPLDPAFAFLIGGTVAGLASSRLVQALTMAFLAQLATLGVYTIAWGQQAAPQVSSSLAAFSFVAVLGGALLGWALARFFPRKWAASALLGVLVVVFFSQGMVEAKPLAEYVSTEMANEQYSFDPVFFVKVFYLQNEGESFYKAYGDAFAGDKRFDAPPSALKGWRSPTTSTMWALIFSNASQIVYAFLLLAAGSMVAAYYLAARISDEVSALVVPALLAPYYLAALSLFWFTEYEFWAAFAVMGAAVLMSLKRRWPALGLAVLGGVMREWLVSATMAGSIELLLQRKWKQAIPWVLGAFAVAAAYVLNMVFVTRYLQSVGITPTVGANIGGGGVGFILYTLKFCSDYLAHPLIVAYVVFALALVGAVRRIIAKDYFIPSLLILPLFAFMLFGSGQTPLGPTGWNDYYSASFWPFALVLVPAAWHLVSTRRTKTA